MDLENRKVLIFGTGKSGISAASLLLKTGAEPVLYDGNEKLDPEVICRKVGAEVRVILGEMPKDEIGEMDLLVMSPGISCEHPLVAEFKKRKLPVWGEVELAYQAGRGQVFAVTGTNGKTTTVSLLGKILQDYFPEVYVVGNIGIPYTDVALEQTDAARTAAEISSFQLETIESFHARAAAITNITEDHLNRHHTMEEYIRVKERIFENQTDEDVCVLNAEDPILAEFGKTCTRKVVYFSTGRVLDEGLYTDNGCILLAEHGK
ncbi:MAG: UDP-N-acetylmuramoyl-L-alanine--D-glutamate ligase, partial [Eubacterium sp.]|nr:UDP-N-acetylmuramoyl-L-alanine--D-glutamate ligase [Eubacterium sp.]